MLRRWATDGMSNEENTSSILYLLSNLHYLHGLSKLSKDDFKQGSLLAKPRYMYVLELLGAPAPIVLVSSLSD